MVQEVRTFGSFDFVDLLVFAFLLSAVVLHSFTMRRTVIVPKAKAVRKVSNNDWETKMDEVEVSRDQIHRMIMDYFVVEGYASAATAFSKESNCAETSSPQKKTLSERSSVICAMNEGDCSTAIALTNKINPDVLEEDPSVAFAVALQQLIELIREKELDECLDFAHEEIVSRCEDNVSHSFPSPRSKAVRH